MNNLTFFNKKPLVKTKVFITTTPFSLNDFLVRKIFKEASINDDYLLYELFLIFKNQDEDTYHEKIKLFSDKIYHMSKLLFVEFDISEAIYQFIELCQSLKKQLIEFNFYNDKKLIFNNIWFDFPDTVIFIRLEQSDV